MFDWWVATDDPEFHVRFLTEYSMGILGVPSSLDAFGGDVRGLLTIETDGEIQLLDVLRICGSERVRGGWHLETTSFRQAVAEADSLVPPPCQECRECRAFGACGGGYLPHRWDGQTRGVHKLGRRVGFVYLQGRSNKRTPRARFRIVANTLFATISGDLRLFGWLGRSGRPPTPEERQAAVAPYSAVASRRQREQADDDLDDEAALEAAWREQEREPVDSVGTR